MNFRFPPGDSRTAVIGRTGSGKTTFGAWLLSRARFDVRPWVIIDFKGEPLFDAASPPIQDLRLGTMPGKRGLYRVMVMPQDSDALEEYLWKIWARGNIGLFIDEASLMPRRHAFEAILRQGRSKRIPVIACSQRPVDVDREVFSEAGFFAVFRLNDERDYKTVRGFSSKRIAEELEQRHCFWYDADRETLLRLAPCPGPDSIIQTLRERVPYTIRFW